MTRDDIARARSMLRTTWTAPAGATPEQVAECDAVERMHQAIALMVRQGLSMAAFLATVEDAFCVEAALQTAEKALEDQQAKRN